MSSSHRYSGDMYDDDDGMGFNQDDIEISMVDVGLDNPKDTINAYYDLLGEATGWDEIFTILTGIFYDGVSYGRKKSLIDSLNQITERLNDST